MKVAIAGAHGQVARLLTRRLAASGDQVRGVIRRPEQSDDVREDGAEPVVLDLEEADERDLAAVVSGCDAVVFAAGAGPGSGARRKETVDYGAATRLVGAAQTAAVRRYVMVSSIGADDPPDGDDVFSVYLRAKARADRYLTGSDLDWTVVRPGGLTDDPGAGTVTLGTGVPRGRISRDDVAAVIAEALRDRGSVGRVVEVVGGDTPIQGIFSRS